MTPRWWAFQVGCKIMTNVLRLQLPQTFKLQSLMLTLIYYKTSLQLYLQKTCNWYFFFSRGSTWSAFCWGYLCQFEKPSQLLGFICKKGPFLIKCCEILNTRMVLKMWPGVHTEKTAEMQFKLAKINRMISVLCWIKAAVWHYSIKNKGNFMALCHAWKAVNLK